MAGSNKRLGGIKGRIQRFARGRQALQIKKGRKLDREAYKAGGRTGEYYVHSGVPELNIVFKQKFAIIVRGMVEQKALEARFRKGGKAEPVNILEISSGQSNFLRQLKIRFEGSIRAFATGVTSPPGRMPWLERYYVGQISSGKTAFSKGTEKFDLIVCHGGETQLVDGNTMAKNILSRLTRKGVAFFDIGNWPKPIMNEILDNIESHGFKAEIVNEWIGEEQSTNREIGIKITRKAWAVKSGLRGKLRTK